MLDSLTTSYVIIFQLFVCDPNKVAKYMGNLYANGNILHLITYKLFYSTRSYWIMKRLLHRSQWMPDSRYDE